MNTERLNQITSDVNLYIIRIQLDALISTLSEKDRETYKKNLLQSADYITNKFSDRYTKEELEQVKGAVNDGILRNPSKD